jgi:uncharacterized protein YegJ (DUF2314 family)
VEIQIRSPREKTIIIEDHFYEREKMANELSIGTLISTMYAIDGRLKTLLPGKLVKVPFPARFRAHKTAESMWVEVKGPTEKDGTYSGTLANDPALRTDLKHGDLVTFTLFDIVDIEQDSGRSYLEDYRANRKQQPKLDEEQQ